MLGFASAIIRKDIKMLCASGAAIYQPLLLGALIIFLFSLANGIGEVTTPRQAASLFWISSLFFQVIIFSQLYAFEENNLTRHALFLSNAPIQGVWLGKGLAGMFFLCLAQLVFLPAIIIFLNQSIKGPLLPGVLGIMAGNTGMAILGSLLGAISQGHGSRDAMLGVLLFPLLTPLLMASLSLCAQTLGDPAPVSYLTWLGVAVAFDAVYAAAALLLFGLLYRGDS